MQDDDPFGSTAMKKTALSVVVIGLLLWASQAFAVNPMLLKQKSAAKKVPDGAAVQLPQDLRAEDVDAIIARLDDDQVRRLLIAQLQAEAQKTASAGAAPGPSGLARMVRWFESRSELLVSRIYRLGTSLPEMPGDFGRAMDQLTDYQGAGRFWLMVLMALVFLGIGYGAEKLFHRLTAAFREQIDTMPGMDGILKFWGAVMRFIPELLGLLVFALTPFVLFFMTVSKEDKGLRFLFLAFLLTAVAIRLGAALLRLILSPGTAKLRLVKLSDGVARYLYRRLLGVACILAVGMILQLLLERLGTTLTSRVWVAIIFGTAIIAVFADMIWRHRHQVRDHLMQRAADGGGTSLWLRDQFAGMWHVLALAYLFLVWGFGFINLVTTDELRMRGTFVLSLLIVPFYLALDRLALWCLDSTVAPQIGTLAPTDQDGGSGPAGGVEADPTSGDKVGYLVIVRRVVRVVVFAAVVLWFLDVWGFRVPIGETAVKAIFNILVTLLLAHLLWELISAAISRKLGQGGFVEEAKKEDDEDEWGATGAQDRSHTLLPMLRKFLGVVIVIMTTMIVLSSIGVDIGPLMAGAGVIGLAIGFGAQKLVRDILSGIFFLMDDAFRVGEYVEAGGVSGTVEQITLRTIKLRHHRGMLQIVPLGDLKSVTNFMRGGMVVKFDLKLPYDTDIDKVRKIIKKVGKKMLLDEELGPDFIKPLKSQGVRSVGDSVMTFRAKFTARPGTHFVIRREAYKHITAALEKAGIFYAHRKVIVDLAPELAEKMDVGAASTARAGDAHSDKLTPEEKAQILTAGAAAARDPIGEDEEGGPKGKKKKK
jgi:small-conductance mechanosensitive channel